MTMCVHVCVRVGGWLYVCGCVCVRPHMRVRVRVCVYWWSLAATWLRSHDGSRTRGVVHERQFAEGGRIIILRHLSECGGARARARVCVCV